ncbi:protein arginine N-methyltransferase 7-like [Corticium candelabrum]|uniref:protein arginine N-methyltransferase 7-like n=1 Tax=Corticium candelabrum TaxID=121492 RepID=UPI002E25A865|nr:protein arginine N-methyltransferase 7-like [Corticium candelabrum]
MMFVFKPNPVTGSIEWVARKDDDQAFADDIAKSQYGDMLHDAERNEKYYDAIRLAVNRVQSSGQKVHVLDIGTGTGLLAMMAAKCGADQVSACEVFQPMANIAKKIIKENKLDEKISVISKRSTEITVGPDGDLQSKANVLVSELFDTELIGEGVLSTLKHALENLVEPDCIVVPSLCQVYVQLVESEIIASCHKLNKEKVFSQYGRIHLTDRMLKCVGSQSLQDLHVSELPSDGVKLLSRPIPVFEFDFTSSDKILLNNFCSVSFACTETGRGNALIMWWDVMFDMENKISLSTAPAWARTTKKQWRDHWLQAIQHLEPAVTVEQGNTFAVNGAHDDYSMWFNVSKTAEESAVVRPVCTCSAHLMWSCSRFSMLNDSGRTAKYEVALRNILSQSSCVSTCLSISDGSLLPFLAVSLGIEKVVCSEEVSKSHQITRQLVETNNMTDQILVLPKKAMKVAVKDFEFFVGKNKFDLLMGEPYFTASILPWHLLFFWYARTHVDEWLSEDVKIMPHRGSIRAIAVQFRDLWKLRSPVGCVEGFNLSLFDKYTEACPPAGTPHDKTAASWCQPLHMSEPDSHALWEYPGIPLSAPADILEFDFTRIVPDENLTSSVKMPFISKGVCHGLVYWMEYQLDELTMISTGLEGTAAHGQTLTWNRHSKQAVSFFLPHIDTQMTSRQNTGLHVHTEFDVQTGSLKFKVLNL